MKLLLASASPRRAQILRDAGFCFETCAPHIDESRLPDEPTAMMVARLAELKARAGVALCHSAAGENIVVVGADTCVEQSGQIFGKPRDAAHAREMLAALNGRTHNVLTGIAVLRLHADSTHDASDRIVNARVATAVEITQVIFAPLTPAEIDAYIATGEPMDKAGAYAIQGRAARYIPRIEGCYFNVVGLPIARLHRLLQSLP